MTTVITSWTDENGNTATLDFWGSEDVARASLTTLKNCRNCTDCASCRNCTDCTDCTSCMRVKDIKEKPAVVGPFRSDNYQFVITKDGGVRAGCRVFDNFTDAREHWKTTRGDTPLGRETMRILDWCELEYKERNVL